MNEPEIITIAAKNFTGICMRMSFSNHRPFEVWSRFMPRRKEIGGVKDGRLYSIEVFPKGFFENYSADAEFEKWAASEVQEAGNPPAGMQELHCPEGLYAVFVHKGPDSRAAETYNYIFSEWLPASGYEADYRPHFAVMGEKYKRGAEDSEEDICIPVKKKSANTKS